MTSRINDDLIVTGAFTAGSMVVPDNSIYDQHIAPTATIQRTKLEQNTFMPYPVNMTDFREWDAMAVNLPATASGTYLGLYTGTIGTDAPKLRTTDLKAAGSTTMRARTIIPIPAEYDAGQTLQVRVRGGMKTTIADTLCTVLVEAYRCDEDGGVSGNLVTTSATTINSLTKANVDFKITPTTVNPGDRLDVRVSVTCSDAATVTAVIAEISRVALLADIRG